MSGMLEWRDLLGGRSLTPSPSRLPPMALETSPQLPRPSVRSPTRSPAGSTGSARCGSRARWRRSAGGRASARSSSRCATRSPTSRSRVTCQRDALRLAQPAAGRGRPRRPARQARRSTPTAAPCRSPPARSGSSASASCSPGSSAAASCWRPRACSPPSSSAACRSCPAARPGHRRATPPPSATWSRTPGAAGPRCAFETAYAAMQGTRAAAEVIAAIERLDRDERVDVIVIARGGGARRGPAALLRRGL